MLNINKNGILTKEIIYALQRYIPYRYDSKYLEIPYFLMMRHSIDFFFTTVEMHWLCDCFAFDYLFFSFICLFRTPMFSQSIYIEQPLVIFLISHFGNKINKRCLWCYVSHWRSKRISQKCSEQVK